MELSDFVEQTLFEIALGVMRAKLKAKNLAAIVPPRVDGTPASEATYVEFDVSLVAHSSATKSVQGGSSAGAKLRIAVVEADVSLKGDAGSTVTERSESTHRLAFKVPVHFAAHYRSDPAIAGEEVWLESAYPRTS